MTAQKKDIFDSSASRLISEDDLLNYVKGLPALLFRVEMARNRIEYLNDCNLAGLGENTFQLLNNKNLAKEVLFEEDIYLYDNFIHALRESEQALTVIRIKQVDNGLRWIKLIGKPNSYNPGFYLGMMVDITDSIKLIEDMTLKEDEKQTMLEIADNPVFLVDIKTKNVVSHNAAAQELFGYSFDEFRQLNLVNLMHPAFAGDMAEILEEIIFEKRWKGRMLFRRKGNTRFLGEVSLRSLKIKEKRLLRVSVYSFDIITKEKSKSERQKENLSLTESRKLYVNSLNEKIQAVSDIRRVLEIILGNPYSGTSFDGIIYSDIQIKKDRVVVYAAGDTFFNLKFGESFSYEGTIAENIENYKLDFLIVEDTMSSIKAIDWALFTPYGIRSYYAKPFYERNVLRSILILCSKEPDAFSEEKIPEYNLLDSPFTKGLKNWRKARRSGNSS